MKREKIARNPRVAQTLSQTLGKKRKENQFSLAFVLGTLVGSKPMPPPVVVSETYHYEFGAARAGILIEEQALPLLRPPPLLACLRPLQPPTL